MKNPLSVHTVCYKPEPLEVALDGIARSGATYVEIAAIPGLAEHWRVAERQRGAEALVRRLTEYGLTLSSVSAHSNLTTEEGVEHLARAIELAPLISAQTLNTYIGVRKSDPDTLPTFFRNLRPLADSAEAHGVTIAVEVYGDLMSTGRMAAEVIHKFDHPAVRMIYDTANCKTYGGMWAHENDDLLVALPLIVNLHLKDKVGDRGDFNYPPIGQGNVDFGQVFSILERGGYTGPLSIEIEFDNGVWPDRKAIDNGVDSSVAHVQALLAGARTPGNGG
jgi:L-ribulose-5-phosphate 3-epimerase